MTKQQAQQLLQRYRMGQCNPEEQKIVESWIEQELTIGSWERTAAEKRLFGNSLKERIDLALNFNIMPVPSTLAIPSIPSSRSAVRSKLWLKLSIAAAIILVPAFIFLQHNHWGIQLNTLRYADISPGKNAATLTLANGKKIVLGARPAGKLASEAGMRISKTADGQLRYEILAGDPTHTANELQYNTLTTAKGQQYQVLLPDGTKVWLNNASSLTYPVSLNTEKKRRVELKGEAYFEVAKNKERPFIVQTAEQEIKVLGTHFNVNGYENEPDIKTTLLEGAIQINTAKQGQLLSPGQQAIVTPGRIKVLSMDTELAVAWKNNQFMFESEGIESIMRRIERWYNVKVEYTGDIPDDKFGGVVSRFGNVSELLLILELTGKVHFKVEGRRIMVSK
jgi:transmembrane sensor